MSVDYEANYGIGYKVCESVDIADTEEMEDGLGEYIENEVGEGYEWFQTGSSYSGEIDGVYITIENPFKKGLDLTKAKADLDKEIKRLKLETESEFNEVGGLYVF